MRFRKLEPFFLNGSLRNFPFPGLSLLLHLNRRLFGTYTQDFTPFYLQFQLSLLSHDVFHLFRYIYNFFFWGDGLRLYTFEQNFFRLQHFNLLYYFRLWTSWRFLFLFDDLLLYDLWTRCRLLFLFNFLCPLLCVCLGTNGIAFDFYFWLCLNFSYSLFGRRLSLGLNFIRRKCDLRLTTVVPVFYAHL